MAKSWPVLKESQSREGGRAAEKWYTMLWWMFTSNIFHRHLRKTNDRFLYASVGEDSKYRRCYPCLLKDVCIEETNVFGCSLPILPFSSKRNCYSLRELLLSSWLEFQSLSLCLHQKRHYETTDSMRASYSYRFSPEVGMYQVRTMRVFSGSVLDAWKSEGN